MSPEQRPLNILEEAWAFLLGLPALILVFAIFFIAIMAFTSIRYGSEDEYNFLKKRTISKKQRDQMKRLGLPDKDIDTIDKNRSEL